MFMCRGEPLSRHDCGALTFSFCAVSCLQYKWLIFKVDDSGRTVRWLLECSCGHLLLCDVTCWLSAYASRPLSCCTLLC